MKDERTICAVGVAESRPATSGDRGSEDWSWMVGEDPAFYLQESVPSRGRD